MSTTVSPSTPTVDREAFESFFSSDTYLSSSFITTFTGVSLRSGALSIVTVFTVPIVTPSRLTAAPVFSPAELAKYVVTVSLCEKIPSPDELVIRNRSVTRTTVEINTITPTFNCDHRTSCWLGIALLKTLVQKTALTVSRPPPVPQQSRMPVTERIHYPSAASSTKAIINTATLKVL